MLAKKKINRIFGHVLFWLAYWIFLSFSAGLYDLDFVTVSLYTLSSLPLTIITTYIFVYRIFPFFWKGKKFVFFCASGILLISALLLNRISLQHLIFPLLYSNSDWTFKFFDWYRIVGHLLQLSATIALASALKMYREWDKTKDKLDIAQTEKIKLELSYLKAQTSPHFLFNTLNAIYYELAKEKSNAGKSIIALSEILRFILYECQEDFIEIEKEIHLIRNYIELQKSRYKNRLNVVLNTSGDLSKTIPPLISFSLIENAFKHGISESVGKCTLEITIEIDTNNYAICIKNPVSEPIEFPAFENSKGLGLANVKRQLDLIYGETYSLKNQIEDDTYICTLNIPLGEKH